LQMQLQTEITVWCVDLKKVKTDQVGKDLDERRPRYSRRIIKSISQGIVMLKFKDVLHIIDEY